MPSFYDKFDTVIPGFANLCAKIAIETNCMIIVVLQITVKHIKNSLFVRCVIVTVS